jgi:glycosyltransferase involved in cell wall biosynthesis
MVYLVRALQQAGVRVRVYTLGEGEFYEGALRDAGLNPIRVGQATHPLLRLVTVARALRRFRPHIVQAAHFYVNLYVALASRVCGSLAIGAIPSDAVLDLQDTGPWGTFLLRAPAALWTNSQAARRNATRLGISRAKIHVIPNVIDASPFERACSSRATASNLPQTIVILVAQLVRAKRVDRFLEALALARRSEPGLRGMVVGDGPEGASLRQHAGRLGLLPDGLEFRGWSDEVPGLMAKAQILASTSDHEGLSNVLLEAMAARLPVVTTPAGDAPTVVEDGITGFVVPFEGSEELADRLIRLACSPDLRRAMGEAGHERVTARYAPDGLSDRLMAVYRAAAQETRHLEVLRKLPPAATCVNPAARPGVNTS